MNIKKLVRQIGRQMEIELPDDFSTHTDLEQRYLLEYLNQLEPIERVAYRVAKQHLETSFSLVLSNGFCQWRKQKAARVIGGMVVKWWRQRSR